MHHDDTDEIVRHEDPTTPGVVLRPGQASVTWPSPTIVILLGAGLAAVILMVAAALWLQDRRLMALEAGQRSEQCWVRLADGAAALSAQRDLAQLDRPRAGSPDHERLDRLTTLAFEAGLLRDRRVEVCAANPDTLPPAPPPR